MSLSHEIRRFNWIRIYCDAMRWALVNELTAGRYARITTFQTLCQAVTWQRDRHTQRGQRPPRGKLHAFFFDPLWRYSESYRYRLPLADEYVRDNPYYWGLNLRWLGSALIGLVELWLYTLSARHLRGVWGSYARQSRAAALPVIQLPRWRTIRDQQPQLLV